MLRCDLSTPKMKKNAKKGSLESDFTESVEIVGNGKVFQIWGPQPHLSGSPNVGSNASGRSRRMISWRISQVKGSM